MQAYNETDISVVTVELAGACVLAIPIPIISSRCPDFPGHYLPHYSHAGKGGDLTYREIYVP